MRAKPRQVCGSLGAIKKSLSLSLNHPGFSAARVAVAARWRGLFFRAAVPEATGQKPYRVGQSSRYRFRFVTLRTDNLKHQAIARSNPSISPDGVLSRSTVLRQYPRRQVQRRRPEAWQRHETRSEYGKTHRAAEANASRAHAKKRAEEGTLSHRLRVIHQDL